MINIQSEMNSRQQNNSYVSKSPISHQIFKTYTYIYIYIHIHKVKDGFIKVALQ